MACCFLKQALRKLDVNTNSIYDVLDVGIRIVKGAVLRLEELVV